MILVAALILDALLGEPRLLWDRLPHPAIVMGRLIGWCDTRFNRPPAKAMGLAVVAMLVVAAAATGILITQLPGAPLWSLILTAILLAQRSLVDHVGAVADAMQLSTDDGRRAVARIVGRDTGGMDDTAIARAAIESGAENFSDGVVAPAFWFAVAGLPGILIYKIVNTADSMIGYRTPRHESFGWAAARLDDALNWIPARLTAAMILLVHARPHLWRIVTRDAALHRSPNAGWPEAAMAAILNVALSGPRSYDGEVKNFPFVHPDGTREVGPRDIGACIRVLWRSWALLAAMAAIIAVL